MRTVKLTVRTTQTKIYGDGAGQEPYSPPAPETADDPFGGLPEFPEDIEDAVIRTIEEAARSPSPGRSPRPPAWRARGPPCRSARTIPEALP